MKTSAVAFLLLTTVCSLRAQNGKPQGLTSQANQTDSAMTAETRKVFQTVETDIVKTAREMPERSYTFTPVKGVRTSGELMAHIANVQGTLCGISMETSRPRRAVRRHLRKKPSSSSKTRCDPARKLSTNFQPKTPRRRSRLRSDSLATLLH